MMYLLAAAAELCQALYNSFEVHAHAVFGGGGLMAAAEHPEAACNIDIFELSVFSVTVDCCHVFS
jgi:hypothetical protein